MSDEPRRKSRVLAWMLSIAAAPVLYLLSWGPIDLVYTVHRHPMLFDDFETRFYEPVWWLRNHTVLGDALDGISDLLRAGD